MYLLHPKFILKHIFNKQKGSLLTKSTLQAEKLIARINDLNKDRLSVIDKIQFSYLHFKLKAPLIHPHLWPGCHPWTSSY